MTLPTTIDPTTPAGSSARSLGDDQIRALKQAVIDILGIGGGSTIAVTQALFEVDTGGLKSVIFEDVATPTTQGYLSRTTDRLRFHDGSAAQELAYIADLITIRLTNKTGATRAAGDIVGLDAANNSAVTLADTVRTVQPLVVAAEVVAQNAVGRWYQVGVATVKVASAVIRGNYLVKSATTLVAEDGLTVADATTEPPPGVFAVALTANAAGPGTVQAFLLGHSKFPNRAPNDAQYVTMAADSTLTSERRLQVASGISMTDGGAGGDVMLISDSRVIDRATAPVFVHTTTTETTVYSVTITAGMLSTNRRLRLEMQARLQGLNAAGTTKYMTIRVKYDGTTIAEINPLTFKNNGTSAAGLTDETGCRIVVLLNASGFTNKQTVMIDCGPGYFEVLDAFDVCYIANASSGRGLASIDSTIGKTLAITARPSASNSADRFVMENAVLVLE